MKYWKHVWTGAIILGIATLLRFADSGNAGTFTFRPTPPQFQGKTRTELSVGALRNKAVLPDTIMKKTGGYSGTAEMP